ncbi:MAG: penicillin acylase family protein [Nitrososphaerota archaeon]
MSPRLRRAIASTASVLVLAALLLVSGPLQALHPVRGIWTEIDNARWASGEVRLKGLKGTVTVVVDSRGVPHVFAEDELDALRVLGYLHARERLWQMDVQRRLASGRLSELLGEAAFRTDLLMRVIGLHRSARSTARWLEQNRPDVYGALKAYADGVNAAIEELRSAGRLPMTFKLLGYEPEPWKVEDSILWAKYMAWTLTGFWYPLLLTYLAIKLGPDAVAELYPVRHYYSENVTVVPGDGSIAGASLGVEPEVLMRLDWFGEWATGVDLTDPELSRELAELIERVAELARITPSELGSNNWVVGPMRSATGGPILADDPHLPLNLPSLWYEVHLVTRDYNVRGVTLPGVPFVVIGFNEHLAWGLTNSQIGVTDFYIEKVQGDRYLFRGEWRPLERVVEEITVRGQGVRRITVNLTVHGPLFSHGDLHVSLKWTGNTGFNDDGSGVTREAVAAYMLMRARGLNDLLEALKFWDVPSQNWAFVDRDGNFGIVIPGLFPFRVVRLPDGREVRVIGSRSVLNGTGGHEWAGFVPFSQVPMTVNPERGYAAAPNQLTVGPRYPYFILGGWYDPGARAQRIHWLLASKALHSVEDFASYQCDTVLWFARSVTPRLIASVERFPDLDGRERRALEDLRGWDYSMSRDSVAPTVFWAWFSALYDEAFKRPFSERGVRWRLYPLESTLVWLINERPDSPWFGGNLSLAARRALRTAVERLTEALGPDVSGWSWGRVHRLRIGHLTSLDALSIGPLPHDGSSGTLLNAGFPYDLSALGSRTFVTTGPSWRMIVTFTGDRVEAYGVYPGGQSENPISEHYSDSFDEWYACRLHRLEAPPRPDQVIDRVVTIAFRGSGT